MFNLLLALIAGLVIGWNFHAFFIQLDQPQIVKSAINTSEKITEDLSTIKPTPQSNNEKILNDTEQKNKTVPKTDSKKDEVIIKKDPFFALLEKNLFSDAMAQYLDAHNEKLPLYRSTLLSYFKNKSINKPQEAINQMIEFMELEPKHQAVGLELINTYKQIKAYPKAIDVITQMTETATATELERLYADLLTTSQHYIDELNRSKAYKKLLTFLEKRIEIGIKTPFYLYSLAKYYIEIQNYDEAIILLKEIEYDYDYGGKAKNLLKMITKKINANKEYSYQLPLKKVGEHFTINAYVNETPLTLLLDTGATLTMVNEAKLSSLTMIKEHILLNTAGGEINAQLQEADTFSIEEIHLEKFQIVSSSFEQEGADGLLGMNFFKKFKFKIDQENALLYLSPKETAL